MSDVYPIEKFDFKPYPSDWTGEEYASRVVETQRKISSSTEDAGDSTEVGTRVQTGQVLNSDISKLVQYRSDGVSSFPIEGPWVQGNFINIQA